MFRNNLLKLNVTLVLLVATAFVSVTAVAAAGSYTIIQVKAASSSAALGGTADTSDWYGRHPEARIFANAPDLSDYFQRHPDAVISASPADLSDYFLRHSDTSIPANTATDASIPSSLDNPNGHWIGPETVSAALGQLQPDLPAGGGMYYGPPGR